MPPIEKSKETPTDTAVSRVETALERRLTYLIKKEEKTGRDFKEIDLLCRQLDRTTKLQQGRSVGNAGRTTRKPSKPKNELTTEQILLVQEAFRENLFAYQERWREAGLTQRIRSILKSRQIGATWYFAREAIADAVKTGRNKIFLSASKAQASIFRSYIRQFIQDVCDIDLTGDPIRLWNNAELYFLGTNSKTAQGYHGDVYLDEYFWISRFLEFRKVVSGMAMHKKWKQTYSSTPSSITHEAFEFWNGDLFNKRKRQDQRIEVRTDHESLAEGKLCEDGQWRHIVTIEDAIKSGCDLFDIDQLRLEYSEDEFNNLLMCEFVDDTLSSFPFSLLQGCMVDSWEDWSDFRPFADRPVGDAPVWIGYDPAGDSERSDGAGLVVDLPPATPKGKHRLLEKQRINGDDYEAQAKIILDYQQNYRVERVGIDVTGIGDAVAKIVEQHIQVTRYNYSPILKAGMVMQAQQMMRTNRLEFDAGWSDMAQSFMAIRKTLTPSGRNITYTGGRNAKTGHADLAWAAMHALHHEPIEAPSGGGGTIIEISG